MKQKRLYEFKLPKEPEFFQVQLKMSGLLEICIKGHYRIINISRGDLND